MKTITTRSDFCIRLAKAYPHQARNLSSGPIHIRVDDRDGDDIYPGFCGIHLKMPDLEADQFILILDNIPFNDEVKAVAAELEGNWQETRTGQCLTLNFSSSETEGIIRLATAIRQVIGGGSHYLDRNWKWIARRTAKSLERLTEILFKSSF